MRPPSLRISAAILALAAGFASPAARAATAEDFAAAYASAAAHEQRAAANKNQWPVTKDALTAAKKAADAHDYDNAVALAQKAGALAQASLDQSKSEATAWKDAPIP